MGRAETKTKLDKLAEYKRIREQGGRSQSWKETEDDVYDEVSESQYRKIVKQRLEQNDFVVDDGVGGYNDHGMDDWDREDSDVRHDYNAHRNRKKPSGRFKKSVEKTTKPSPAVPTVVPSMNAYRPAVSAIKEQEMLDSIILSLDSASERVVNRTPLRAPRKRKSSPISSSSPEQYPYHDYSSTHDLSSDGDEIALDDVSSSVRIKRLRTDSDTIEPKLEDFSNLDVNGADGYDSFFTDMGNEAFMDISEIGEAPKKSEPKMYENRVEEATEGKPAATIPDCQPAWLSLHSSLKTADNDTVGIALKPNTGSAITPGAVLEASGSFLFYWLDYLELDGKVYLTGKTRDKHHDTWLSCCAIIENIERNLFVFPRRKELDGSFSIDEVESDFETLRRKAGVKSFTSSWVRRSYAFGDKEIPTGESECLKVIYGFDQPQIASDSTSPNISRILGTGTSAFELLVLKRKMMGPCWLQVKEAKLTSKGLSWCKVEITVTDPKNLNPFLDADEAAPKDMPPLNIVSMSIKTIVNHQENKKEIVCVSLRTWPNTLIEDGTPIENLPCIAQTFVRPLHRFPKDFENFAKETKQSTISTMQNERMLLNGLLVQIQKADPDIIIGHEFLGVYLDVLLHRMRELKTENWSRLGRFRRSKWPNIGRQGSNMKFLAGRLLCDVGSDSTKTMIASTTWSLTEMCSTHLNLVRQDIDPDDTALYFDGTVGSPERLMTFVRHCELDAHFQAAIASKVQILPLTKQLTNLAGNSWNKTLNGGRAERNEYILLHEFHRLKYVCPDKSWRNKAAPKPEPDAVDDGPTTKGKRDKYKGGLVFEPKRGLWDKFILVMDFNSLYPSIIQEYNIDFTTVSRGDEDSDQIPEPPSSEIAQGVLPRLIATLVKRRRQVKSLMKGRNVPTSKSLQYDIKQQALKLTANSMYGCLGYENSRFYAKPLAALTTFKGRGILMDTKELAESLSLDVVYGDTDSVFINSNAMNLADALQVAEQFKKIVNGRYKLLEIDLDSIFQRLLLLQKKKYAAVKVEDSERTSLEIKGLDMKRREYSLLSKNASNFVLERILSGETTETVLEQIQEYLTSLGNQVRGGQIPLDDFQIYKRLGKNPEDYPDAKSQPHVQVALRLKAKGGSARVGDVIPYLFCLSEDGSSSKTGQADRAYHPDEFRRNGSKLKLDFEYYLSQQILPPIERLCGCIEGTDRARLAECLGLDPSHYRSTTHLESENNLFSSLDSQLPDKERFKDCEPFLIQCSGCFAEFTFNSLLDFKTSARDACGFICPNAGCNTELPTVLLQYQLNRQIRKFIAKYYEGWVSCDDPTCSYRTRMMGVYGRRCLKPGCFGLASLEYSDVHLYNQLLSYAALFRAEKITGEAKGTHNSEKAQVTVQQKTLFLQSMQATVDSYIQHCGRCWVELSTLFSFMKV